MGARFEATFNWDECMQLERRAAAARAQSAWLAWTDEEAIIVVSWLRCRLRVQYRYSTERSLSLCFGAAEVVVANFRTAELIKALPLPPFSVETTTKDANTHTRTHTPSHTNIDSHRCESRLEDCEASTLRSVMQTEWQQSRPHTSLTP